MGTSVEAFVDMLAQAKIYAKTATKTRRLMLLVAQSKQAWDWEHTLKMANAAEAAKSGKGPPVSQVFDIHDDPILQYMRISFAEYVELLGRLALQMAHDRIRRLSPSPKTMRTTVSRVAAAFGGKSSGDGGGSTGRISLRSVIASAKKGVENKEGTQKQRVAPAGKGKWHPSLDMDRDEFVEQLPRLFQKLKAMLVEIQLNLRSEGRDSTLKSLLRRSGAAAKASRRGSVVTVMQTVRKKLEAREEEEENALLNSGKAKEFEALRQAVDVSLRDPGIRFSPS